MIARPGASSMTCRALTASTPQSLMPSRHYRKGLEHLGVPRSETSRLDAASLKTILKHTARPGSQHASRMAFDTRDGGSPVLDSILKGIKPPRDLSNRNDFRRCL
jgi:hypothetical protein